MKHTEERKLSENGVGKPKELDGEDCLLLRPLWEEVFYEDSEAFTDYYFAEKAMRNHAFALSAPIEAAEISAAGIESAKKGSYVAMLYLSPYELMIRAGKKFLCAEISYIVGVATKKEYRHRGYMDRLLRASFCRMYEKEQPFAFLMPASPKIYTPYQFVYIYDKRGYAVKANGRDAFVQKGREIREAKPKDYKALAAYASEYLRNHKDVFIKREAFYYEVLAKELAAQNGAVYLITTENAAKNTTKNMTKKVIDGYFLYTQEEEKGAVQEVLPEKPEQESPLTDTGKKIPAIMARVINLRAMLGMMRTRGGSERIYLRVTDAMISENSGIWEWEISEDAAGARKLEEVKIGELCTDIPEVTIDSFTSWVFGYRKAQDCFSFPKKTDGRIKKELLGKLEKVAVLSRVFINEIV